jgi:aminoglycoside 3-N-acetyltransferase
MDSAYTREKLEQAIRDVGIQEGDIVSLQVSLGRLGLMNGVSADFNDISNEVIDSFLSVLGKEGTLLVPTYTYSIGKGEIFDVQHTPSAIGEFPEIFRKKTGAKRSRDPMLSNAAIGPKSDELLKDISKSCYGHGSTFEKMRNSNAIICTLGIGIHWATFRHHIEEMANVPFRFHKAFYGTVIESGIQEKVQWNYFAAPKGVKNCQPNGLPLEEAAKKKRIN